MESQAFEAHAEMIITVTRPDGTTRFAKFVSVPAHVDGEADLLLDIKHKEQ